MERVQNRVERVRDFMERVKKPYVPMSHVCAVKYAGESYDNSV